MNGDYYEVLGIHRTASPSEIKQAFKTQILKHHPDKCHHPSSPTISAIIIQAYRTLSNSDLRSEYDKELETKVKNLQRHVEVSSLDDLLSEAGMLVIECEQCGGKSYHQAEHFGKAEMVYVECEHCGLMVCID